MAAAILVASVSRPAEVADASEFRGAGAAPVAERAAVLEARALAGVDTVAGEAAITEAFEARLGVVASRWKDRIINHYHRIEHVLHIISNETCSLQIERKR